MGETNSGGNPERYRAGGIRTRGLLHPRQALYQAEPQPELLPRSNRHGSISRITRAEARPNKRAPRVLRAKFESLLYANRPSPRGDGRAKPNKQTSNQPSRRNMLCCAARRRRRICVHETATIRPTIGKRALISGTGTTPTLAVETTDTSVEPLGTAANWTLGAETDCSSPVLAMASSSSVVGRAAVAQTGQTATAPAQ